MVLIATVHIGVSDSVHVHVAGMMQRGQVVSMKVMFNFSAVLMLLQSVKSNSMGLIVHWSMDLHNDVTLMPDYGNETRFHAYLPPFTGQHYFTGGIIGEALSLSSQKVILISNVRRNDCIRNPVKCKEGLTVSFWLYLKELTRQDYQVILRSTSFDSSGPGVYIGGSKNRTLMRFLVRTAAGIEYSRTIPWSKVRMKWCHLALKWNASHGLEVFLNGSSVTDGIHVTQSRLSYPTRSRLTAGDVLGPVFLLDDVWIFYNSLPEDTIQKIYELGLPPSKTLSSDLRDSNLSDNNDFPPTTFTMRTTTLLRSVNESSPMTLANSTSVGNARDIHDSDVASAISSSSLPDQISTTSSSKTNLSISILADADSLSKTTTRVIIPKRTPPTLSTISYAGWFYNQTWYHIFIAMTLLVLLAISTWLCMVHCLLPTRETPVNTDTKPFIEKQGQV